MLDPKDGLALELARDGRALAVRILETDERFVVHWTHEYQIDGDVFTVVDVESARTRAITGYPLDALVRPD